MTVSITINGVAYDVPSSAADTNWAADQVAFEQALAAALAPPTWVTLAPINDWLGTAKYYKDSAGTAHLRFVVNRDSGSSGIPLTMPSGYRPPAAVAFVAANPGFGAATVTVAANGEVTITDCINYDPTGDIFLECAFSTVA